ncbi:MarR family winged helix-turn-helix transcriptional regulator [Cellulomonas composti]|nr:MarR family transcriptional regulator [Cellulomonas composti]
MDEAVRDVELQVAMLLRLADRNRRSNVRLDRTLERSAYLALLRLAEVGPLAINEIAEHLRLDASTVTRQVLAMESAGYVSRGRDDADARRSVIAMTPAGRAALDGTREARASVYAELLADWDDAERRVLADALARLNDSLDRGIGR